MNTDFNAMSLFIQIYGLFSIVPSVLIALILESTRRIQSPNTQSYKYGFFVGCISISAALPGLLFLYIAISGGKVSELFLICFFWAACLSICGYYIIKRQKWAWVIGTVLTINPLLWVINGSYQKNRWNEFTLEANSNQSYPAIGLPKSINNITAMKSWKIRFAIVLSTLWTLYVIHKAIESSNRREMHVNVKLLIEGIVPLVIIWGGWWIWVALQKRN